jgi:hypothetical protein
MNVCFKLKEKGTPPGRQTLFNFLSSVTRDNVGLEDNNVFLRLYIEKN